MNAGVKLMRVNLINLWLVIAVFGLFSQTSVADEDLGRLFTSPSQRSELDYLRKNYKPQPTIEAKPAPEVKAKPIVPPEIPDALVLQGYVKRHDGKQSTVWINNEMHTENEATKEIIIGKVPSKGNKIAVKVRGNGKVVGLKSGQVYLPQHNKVIEQRNTPPEITSGNIGGESE